MLPILAVAAILTACSTVTTSPAVALTPSPSNQAAMTAMPSTASPPASSPTPAPTTPPEAVVQSFYDWWLHQGATGGDTDFSTRAELSPAFVKGTQDAMHQPFAIEPFLCVQDGPVDRVEAAKATIAGSAATVMITFDLGGPVTRQVELGLGPAGWQITAVRCDLI